MGLLALNRLMSIRRDRRRRPIKDGLVTSAAKRKDSPCPRDDNSRSEKKLKYSGTSLPEDIWHHIHSLLPLRDAARVACVSRSFKNSWRCYPNLSITRKTLGMENEMSSAKVSVVLANRTKHILRNHSGVGIKALELQINDFPVFTASSDVDRWLRVALRGGIEKLDLRLWLHSRDADVYNFPYRRLLDGSGKSIQDLHLSNCAFRPTAGLGCFTSLTSLSLRYVHITGDELRCLLSSSVALVKLGLEFCNKLIFLEIPSPLQRLSHLVVRDCKNLKVIESRAPNLYSFRCDGGALARLSLGDSLQNFKFCHSSWDVFHYACKNHPHMMPNLEALDIFSSYVRDTLVVPGKFLQLRRLCIGFISPDYDYLSLVPFLDACPLLETFMLYVELDAMEEESVSGDSCHYDLRHVQGHYSHRNIKDVRIIGFRPAKSMVELTCHILENAKSLQRLTLDILYNDGGGEGLCSYGKNGAKCLSMTRGMIVEAHKALSSVERYIVRKVPSSVELKVVKPCSRCNPL
uniref:Uncharacterized protein n=1 Tax=Avena sativa TaxID=4498 RepID=A0ACD5YE55_AVESA